MSPYVHLGWFVLLVLIPTASGYGTGAPTGACATMTPGHNNTSPQTAESPYKLEVKLSMTDNDTMHACVKGKSFKGILGQIRVEGKTDPIGTFDGAQLPDHTKVMNCTNDNDTVTHASTDDTPDGACFVWNIHDHNCKHRLHFVATIAENKDTYWVEVKSEVFFIAGHDNKGEDDDKGTHNGATAAGVKFFTFALCSLLAVVAGIVN